MAGTAQTSKFMLGAATVMVGPIADLYNFTPTTHSIGLVKNFTLTSDPTYTELTQGVRGTIVHSTMTSNPVRCSMEVYEFTARNLAYGLGLDGSTLPAPSDAAVSTTTTAEINGDPAPTATVAVTSVTGLSVNDWVIIQSGGDDKVWIRKITAISGTDLTVTPSITSDVAAAATVTKASKIDVGAVAEQPFLAAKIVGTYADESETTIMVPKMRIVRGFSLAFSTDNYGNLPFEMTLYNLTSTDTHYSIFGSASAQIFQSK